MSAAVWVSGKEQNGSFALASSRRPLRKVTREQVYLGLCSPTMYSRKASLLVISGIKQISAIEQLSVASFVFRVKTVRTPFRYLVSDQGCLEVNG